MANLRKITPDMARGILGPSATIQRKFNGGLHITTPAGGDLEIGPKEQQYDIQTGGPEVFEAVVRIGAEAWGSVVARGSPEQIAALLAHGEALNVHVIPEAQLGCGCWSLIVTCMAFMLAFGFTGGVSPAAGFVIAALAAAWVWDHMKASRIRKARQAAQVLRNPFPHIHGNARFSDDEDLRKGGLI